MIWRMSMITLDSDTLVPSLQLLLASYRLLKSAMVADLHVAVAVAVSNRRQNVAAVQLFRPDLHSSDSVEAVFL